MPILDLLGKVFGRLTVVEFAGKNHKKQAKWLCRCQCGTVKVFPSTYLQKGTKSCGCLHREIASNISKKHGCTKDGKPTSEYKSWSAMKSRCYNKKDADYHNYGGRGITVCHEWLNSFEHFVADMGKKPNVKYSIDRIDNNGNYELMNCRWATKKIQNGNRRDNNWLEHEGRLMIQADWATELKLDKRVLNYHLRKMTISEIVIKVMEGGLIDKRRKPYNKLYYKFKTK